MNWFKFASFLISTACGAAELFVKNEKSKKTATALINLAEIMVDGLAKQNPDGTPAAEPYQEPEAVNNTK